MRQGGEPKTIINLTELARKYKSTPQMKRKKTSNKVDDEEEADDMENE